MESYLSEGVKLVSQFAVSESIKMAKETMSYWDVMPPEMQEYILVWKSVGEQRDKMKAVMQELEQLWVCPYNQYATLPWNSPCEPPSSPVFLCSSCSMFGHQVIHVKPKGDYTCRTCRKYLDL